MKLNVFFNDISIFLILFSHILKLYKLFYNIFKIIIIYKNITHHFLFLTSSLNLNIILFILIHFLIIKVFFFILVMKNNLR
jgi:hypothetical protein